MSTEINTRGMVRSKVSSFPAGSDAECLSKLEITGTGKALVNGSYGDNECPVIDDVLPAKDIALGYVDANNKVHYISTLINNPTFSIAEIKSIIGDTPTIIIFIGYPNFMNAVSHRTTFEIKLGDVWIKIPCIDNSGSCEYNSPLTKIDDYSCYTKGFNAMIMALQGPTKPCRFSVEAYNVSSGTSEYSPVIYFTLSE